MKREMAYGTGTRKLSTSIWISRETHARLKRLAKHQGRVVQWLADDLIKRGLATAEQPHPTKEVA